MGEYYKYKNDLQKAKEYFEKSLLIAQQINIVYEIESAADLLSQVYSDLGFLPKGL
jgi:hypothetical protein